MIVSTVLAAQYAGTLDVSDMTRVDARSTIPAPIVQTSRGRGEDVLAWDLATTPAARLHLTDRFWEYLLAYTPTLTAQGIELGFAPQILQTGTASIGWHGRFVRVSVSENASYGVLNSAFLYTAPNAQVAEAPAAGNTPAGQTGPVGATVGSTAPVQTIPAPGDITFGSSSTAASVSVLASRQTTFSLTGAYTTSGGLTDSAKQLLPEQYGPFASATFGYTASRTDTYITLATAGATVTSGVCYPPPGQPSVASFCVIHASSVAVQESYRHLLSDETTLSFNLGASAAVAQTPFIHEAVIDPIALITFAKALGPRNTSALNLSAGFMPTVDIRTGLPSSRAQATASYSEPFASRTIVTFTATGVQSVPIPIPDPFPITSLTAAVDAKYRLDKQLDLGVGVQSVWQNQPPYGNFVLSLGYVSLTGRLPTARF
jgi:hypothetical protein